jgi:hypothetical protein
VGDGCDGITVLFVIDASPSMVEEQASLAASFPRFVEVLEDYRTPQDTHVVYRIGVTESSVNRSSLPPSFGNDGRLLGQNLCGLGEHPWIDGPGGGLEDEFACMAKVGTSGYPIEMQFAAFEAALDKQSKPGMPNEGFYEADGRTLLVVVVITDEDDCSVPPGATILTGATYPGTTEAKCTGGWYEPQYFKDFLDDLTGGKGRYVFVGVAAPPDGPDPCTSAFGKAYRAPRVREIVELCGEFGVFGDICEGDLWRNLERALEKITITCDSLPVV